MSRYKELLAEQYVSEADVQAREADLLDQQSRLNSLERDRAEAATALAGMQNDLNELALKTESTIGTVRGQIETTSEDLSTSESKRTVVITAPVSGVATQLSPMLGNLLTLASQ